jgi:hypothetical protein
MNVNNGKYIFFPENRSINILIVASLISLAAIFAVTTLPTCCDVTDYSVTKWQYAEAHIVA